VKDGEGGDDENDKAAEVSSRSAPLPFVPPDFSPVSHQDLRGNTKQQIRQQLVTSFLIKYSHESLSLWHRLRLVVLDSPSSFG
jgi:hypothetical protein